VRQVKQHFLQRATKQQQSFDLAGRVTTLSPEAID
jgi:hypothetical protein